MPPPDAPRRTARSDRREGPPRRTSAVRPRLLGRGRTAWHPRERLPAGQGYGSWRAGFDGELAADGGERPTLEGLDRPGPLPDDLGDLLDGEIGHDPQEHHLALVGHERLDDGKGGPIAEGPEGAFLGPDAVVGLV